MKRKRYKVGALFGHCGAGRGLPVYIPILAGDIMQAIERAQRMGGIKKRFKYIWHVEEVGPREFIEIREKWAEFKEMMWAREQEKKIKRKRVG